MNLFRRRKDTPAAPQPAPPAEVPTTYRSGYSAYGEDILVISWFQHFSIDVSKLKYLDIGAAHPWKLNNTFALYGHGGSGILVEPDPDQAAQLAAQRPRDTVLKAGVAFDERRSAHLNRMTTSLFNSFSDEQAAFVLKSSHGWQPEQRQELKERLEVELIPINQIIEDHLGGHPPDFLSIDAETKDIDILRQLDLTRFKPWIVCMEAVAERKIADDLFLPHGYTLAAFTPDNFVYMIDPFSSAWHDFMHGTRRHPT